MSLSIKVKIIVEVLKYLRFIVYELKQNIKNQLIGNHYFTNKYIMSSKFNFRRS